MAMTATQFAQYKTSQQNRYNQAHQSNDQDLIKRLEADAKNMGYTLTKPAVSTPKAVTTTVAKPATTVATQKVEAPPKPTVGTPIASTVSNAIKNVSNVISNIAKPATPVQTMVQTQQNDAVKPPVINPIINPTSTYSNVKSSVTNENKDIQNVVNPSNVVANAIAGSQTNKVDTASPIYPSAVQSVLKPQTDYVAGSAGNGTNDLAKLIANQTTNTNNQTQANPVSLAMKPSETNPVLQFSPQVKQQVTENVLTDKNKDYVSGSAGNGIEDLVKLAPDAMKPLETKQSFPTGSSPTTIKKQNGELVEGYVLDGKSYYPDGTRIQTGDQVIVNGKLYEMGTDGRGFEVNQEVKPDMQAGKAMVSSILDGASSAIEKSTGQDLNVNNSGLEKKKEELNASQNVSDISKKVTDTVTNVTDQIKKDTENVKEGIRQNNGRSNAINGSSNQQKEFTYDPSKDALLQAILNVKPYQEQAKAEFNPAQFSYDYNADPIYQQALKNAISNAELNSKRASKNVLEMMNERGILNSSLTSNQLAEIANQYLQQANSDVQSNLVPQLINQAYGRYRDSIADQQFNVNRQDQLNNQNYQRYLDQLDLAQKQAQMAMSSRGQQFNEYQAGLDQNAKDRQLAMQEAGLTGNYNGQQTLESILANRDYNLKRGQLLGSIDGQKTYDAMNADRNYQLDVQNQKLAQDKLNYDKQRNAKLDTEESKRWWANYEQQGQQFAKQNSLDWAKLNQAQKEFVADEAYRKNQLSLDQQKINWDKDPTNPINLQRNATAEAKQQDLNDRNEWLANQTKDILTSISNDQISYEDAIKQVDLLEKSGTYQSGEANKIRNTINQVKSEEEKASKMNTVKNIANVAGNEGLQNIIKSVLLSKFGISLY